MKIKKLIEELSSFNQDADITTPYSEDICLGWICKDPKTGVEFSKETTRQVFIEFDDECPSCTHSFMDGDVRWCSFYDMECSKVDECYQFAEFEEL